MKKETKKIQSNHLAASRKMTHHELSEPLEYILKALSDGKKITKFDVLNAFSQLRNLKGA